MTTEHVGVEAPGTLDVVRSLTKYAATIPCVGAGNVGVGEGGVTGTGAPSVRLRHHASCPGPRTRGQPRLRAQASVCATPTTAPTRINHAKLGLRSVITRNGPTPASR